MCDAYSFINSDVASQRYAACTFSACGGEDIIASGCTSMGGNCNGDQFLRIVSSTGMQVAVNHGHCGSCSQVSYKVPENNACEIFTIAQSCYTASSCSGRVAVSGAGSGDASAG